MNTPDGSLEKCFEMSKYNFKIDLCKPVSIIILNEIKICPGLSNLIKIIG